MTDFTKQLKELKELWNNFNDEGFHDTEFEDIWEWHKTKLEEAVRKTVKELTSHIIPSDFTNPSDCFDSLAKVEDKAVKLLTALTKGDKFGDDSQARYSAKCEREEYLSGFNNQTKRERE